MDGIDQGGLLVNLQVLRVVTITRTAEEEEEEDEAVEMLIATILVVAVDNSVIIIVVEVAAAVAEGIVIIIITLPTIRPPLCIHMRILMVGVCPIPILHLHTQHCNNSNSSSII